MILAIKNKIACYYNTEEEKKELLKIFVNPENPCFNIFLNTEKGKALSYSNVPKITGFLTEKEDPFTALRQLKDKGIQLVSFMAKDKRYCTILNDIYYPSSVFRLEYNALEDKFEPYRFKGCSHDSAHDLCEQIIKYYNERGIMFLKSATKTYMEEYQKQFGKKFWKYVEGSNFFDIEETIIFKCLGSCFTNTGCSSDEYNCDLISKIYDVEINKEDIHDITPIDVLVAIKNDDILSVIEDNLYI